MNELVLYEGPSVHALHPAGIQYTPHCGLLFSEKTGRIIYHGEFQKAMEQASKATVVRIPEGCVLFPGLVDTHTHLPQYGVAGRYDVELLEWLEKYVFPVEASFEDSELALRYSEKFILDLVKGGTTTASIFTTIHKEATDIAFQAAERIGLRALIGKVMMDVNCPESLREDAESAITIYRYQTYSRLI